MEEKGRELNEVEIIIRTVMGRKPKRVTVIMVLDDGTTAVGGEIPDAISQESERR